MKLAGIGPLWAKKTSGKAVSVRQAKAFGRIRLVDALALKLAL